MHGYGVLEQPEIMDTENCIAEDQLWTFLKATQADTLKKLAEDYGTDAQKEVFKTLRKELEHTPLFSESRRCDMAQCFLEAAPHRLSSLITANVIALTPKVMEGAGSGR